MYFLIPLTSIGCAHGLNVENYCNLVQVVIIRNKMAIERDIAVTNFANQYLKKKNIFSLFLLTYFTLTFFFIAKN